MVQKSEKISRMRPFTIWIIDFNNKGNRKNWRSRKSKNLLQHHLQRKNQQLQLLLRQRHLNQSNQSRNQQKLLPQYLLVEKMTELKDNRLKSMNKSNVNGTMQSQPDMPPIKSIVMSKDKVQKKEEHNRKRGIETIPSYRFILIQTIVRHTEQMQKQIVKNLSST